LASGKSPWDTKIEKNEFSCMGESQPLENKMSSNREILAVSGLSGVGISSIDNSVQSKHPITSSRNLDIGVGSSTKYINLKNFQLQQKRKNRRMIKSRSPNDPTEKLKIMEYDHINRI